MRSSPDLSRTIDWLRISGAWWPRAHCAPDDLLLPDDEVSWPPALARGFGRLAVPERGAPLLGTVAGCGLPRLNGGTVAGVCHDASHLAVRAHDQIRGSIRILGLYHVAPTRSGRDGVFSPGRARGIGLDTYLCVVALEEADDFVRRDRIVHVLRVHKAEGNKANDIGAVVKHRPPGIARADSRL